ncbi:hypothetical protein [Photobacterium frigidiphilum]|uniref:hypothetical protein n=1 Tax=Photobacterium frigidiphilum TaxID=264736 RepID=UPI00187E4362|nr:hypothetical protein [Photobacterium frigidiphilum]
MASIDDVAQCLKSTVKTGLPTEAELAKMVDEKLIEKYDEYLPDELLCEGYGYRAFDCVKAEAYLTKLVM